jgi:hypothetical protein
MIDHIEAFSSGGTHGEANFAVACAKCNGRKSNREKIAYLKANPRRLVRGKYGEPTNWDGLVAVFLTFARLTPGRLTAGERRWAEELERYILGQAAG